MDPEEVMGPVSLRVRVPLRRTVGAAPNATSIDLDHLVARSCDPRGDRLAFAASRAGVIERGRAQVH